MSRCKSALTRSRSSTASHARSRITASHGAAQILDIVTTAAILFAVAAGLLIVFGVMKIINFAHGGFLTVGGYSALLVTKLGWNPWLSLGFAFVIGCVCGMIIERLVVRPLYSRPLDAILATWGLGIIIGQVITLAFGREVQFVQSPVTGADRPAGRVLLEYRSDSRAGCRRCSPSRTGARAERHRAWARYARGDHERGPRARPGHQQRSGPLRHLLARRRAGQPSPAR